MFAGVFLLFFNWSLNFQEIMMIALMVTGYPNVWEIKGVQLTCALLSSELFSFG